MYHEGKGVLTVYEEARKLFEEVAARLSHLTSHYYLEFTMLKERGASNRSWI